MALTIDISINRQNEACFLGQSKAFCGHYHRYLNLQTERSLQFEDKAKQNMALSKDISLNRLINGPYHLSCCGCKFSQWPQQKILAVKRCSHIGENCSKLGLFLKPNIFLSLKCTSLDRFSPQCKRAFKVSTSIHLIHLPCLPACLTWPFRLVSLTALFVPASNTLILLKWIVCKLIYLEQSTSLRYL